ncbi:hypothetical protein Tcan_16314 [Toxocara canis]|uniref:Uncharacterized protein n=1 Tax=Toxocara canis TaxID=6265 RepID=A0A0B2VQS5_TOXCA|nr:hypothetical protein Tcan_16314 [Toxocara canis]
MIPIVAINAVLMLSYSIAYAIFLPPLVDNGDITVEVLDSINLYAPLAEVLVLLMPVATTAFMPWMPVLSIHVRRPLFRFVGLERCIKDSPGTKDTAEEAVTSTYFELLKKQWEGKFTQERRRSHSRSRGSAVKIDV